MARMCATNVLLGVSLAGMCVCDVSALHVHAVVFSEWAACLYILTYLHVLYVWRRCLMAVWPVFMFLVDTNMLISLFNQQ